MVRLDQSKDDLVNIAWSYRLIRRLLSSWSGYCKAKYYNRWYFDIKVIGASDEMRSRAKAKIKNEPTDHIYFFTIHILNTINTYGTVLLF